MNIYPSVYINLLRRIVMIKIKADVKAAAKETRAYKHMDKGRMSEIASK